MRRVDDVAGTICSSLPASAPLASGQGKNGNCTATSSTRIFNPRFMSYTVSYQVASEVRQARRPPVPRHRHVFEPSFIEYNLIL